MKRVAIEKILSANDLGFTGSHQAGMLIPKQEDLLSFFPTLDPAQNNPRVTLHFTDSDNVCWKFNYIYYNNKFRGGTRNEYRLTSMTAYLRSCNLKPGDAIILQKEDGDYTIRYKRQEAASANEDAGVVRLVLNDAWKIIDF